MKKNQVQFQPGMSLMVFLDRYGTESQCREALAKVRWPGGFRCQDCGHTGHCHLRHRDVYQCNRCKRQVSLTSGTLFAQTKLPLRTWFLAIYLVTQHKNGISALSLRRQLGVSYNTAWLLKQKLMQAMVERDSDFALGGMVQMDDAYWGGERHGGGTGRGSPGKTPFVAAVQCNGEGHPIAMRMDKVVGFRKKVLAAWAKRYLLPGSAMVSDGLNCFPASLRPTARMSPLSMAAALPAKDIRFSGGSTRCWATSRVQCMVPIMHCVRSTCSATFLNSATASIGASIWRRWCPDSSSLPREPRR